VGSPDPVSQFSGRRYIDLVSYDRNGKPKLTPVLSLEHGGLLYVRTGPTKWKVKRIRRNPRVRIVPCDSKGSPNGTWVEGRALIVEGKELEQATALFKEEFGAIGDLFRRVTYRLFRGEGPTTIIAIRFRPHGEPNASPFQ
jgi:uncharacterized protein